MRVCLNERKTGGDFDKKKTPPSCGMNGSELRIIYDRYEFAAKLRVDYQRHLLPRAPKQSKTIRADIQKDARTTNRLSLFSRCTWRLLMGQRLRRDRCSSKKCRAHTKTRENKNHGETKRL